MPAIFRPPAPLCPPSLRCKLADPGASNEYFDRRQPANGVCVFDRRSGRGCAHLARGPSRLVHRRRVEFYRVPARWAALSRDRLQRQSGGHRAVDLSCGVRSVRDWRLRPVSGGVNRPAPGMCGGVFVYARSRVGPVLGLAAALLVLLLGQASEILYYPGALNHVLVPTCFVFALLCLDRETLSGDLIAALALGIRARHVRICSPADGRDRPWQWGTEAVATPMGAGRPAGALWPLGPHGPWYVATGKCDQPARSQPC